MRKRSQPIGQSVGWMTRCSERAARTPSYLPRSRAWLSTSMSRSMMTSVLSCFGGPLASWLNLDSLRFAPFFFAPLPPFFFAMHVVVEPLRRIWDGEEGLLG